MTDQSNPLEAAYYQRCETMDGLVRTNVLAEGNIDKLSILL